MPFPSIIVYVQGFPDSIPTEANGRLRKSLHRPRPMPNVNGVESSQSSGSDLNGEFDDGCTQTDQ